MATYKGIKGFNIKYLDSDPPNPVEGEIWYNSSAGKLRGYALGTGAWSSGGNMASGVQNGWMSGTTHANSIYFGGGTPPTANTQAYDGTTWTIMV